MRRRQPHECARVVFTGCEGQLCWVLNVRRVGREGPVSLSIPYEANLLDVMRKPMRTTLRLKRRKMRPR